MTQQQNGNGQGLSLDSLFGQFGGGENFARVLLEAGEKPVDLLMRAHLSSEQSAAIAALLYKAGVFKLEHLENLMRFTMASSVGTLGRGRSSFLQAIAHVVVTDGGKAVKGFFSRRSQRGQGDNEDFG